MTSCSRCSYNTFLCQPQDEMKACVQTNFGLRNVNLNLAFKMF